MLLLYRFFTILIFFFFPIIILYRLFKKKEDPIRFLERIGKFKKNNSTGKLIWFHGSSVGEISSIIPLIEVYEKRKDISKILLTSNTLSSSKVIKKFKFKKTIHQFFPIDELFIVKKFLNHWKPNLIVFIESEIWPNMILEIKKKKIPLVLINARITKKAFNKWKKIIFFAKEIFGKFDLCMPQNNETRKYLKVLGTSKILNAGNLKFSHTKIKINNQLKKKQIKFLNSRKILFCAVSTHADEELFCGKLYLNLLKKIKKSIIIIIPRHVDRVEKIKFQLEKINLKVHLHSSKSTIKPSTQIYLVDTFGETELFLKKSKIAFMGGSLIPHGGQNPLEPSRLGCKIIHGPNTQNFKEIYELLNKLKIAYKIRNLEDSKKIIFNEANKTSTSQKIYYKLKHIGAKILYSNLYQLDKYINCDNKKTKILG